MIENNIRKPRFALVLWLCAIAFVVSLSRLGADVMAVQEISVWRDPDKPISDRVHDLMSRLTLKEKISLIYFLAPAIDRLGINAYDHGNECLHGLVRPRKYTVFPQAIAMGATFDPELIGKMATAISDEARATWNETGGKHLGLYSDVLTVWSPVVNMARDPRWGRTQETYGEDPFLTSRIGVSFVHGLQGDDPRYLKVVSTPKHFAGNNEETGRFAKNIVVSERYLREYEFVGFEACVREGRAESIMAAYTAINGVPCSANRWLLTDVLRKEWGFGGYVVSDCGAASHVVDAFNFVSTPEEAIAACLNAGLDMEGGHFSKYPDLVNKYLPAALEMGLVKQEVVDGAVARVLAARFRLGMYDPAALVPYSKISPSVIGSEEHLALARKIADESIVLLKNVPVPTDGKQTIFGWNFAPASVKQVPLLPIDPTRVRKIVVVGPYAQIAQYGDYSGVSTTPGVTPIEGIADRAKKDTIEVISLPWIESEFQPVPSNVLTPIRDGQAVEAERGLAAEYFSTVDFSRPPATLRIDKMLNFNWAHVEPDPVASSAAFAARWTGQIKIERPGVYHFKLEGDGSSQLLIDGEIVIKRQLQSSGERKTAKGKIEFSKCGAHAVTIEYQHSGGETGIIWSWKTPEWVDYFARLKQADLVVAVLGLSTSMEEEGKDRTTLALPRWQDSFIRKVIAQNPRTVVVLEGGSTVAVPWLAENVPALIETWYPGQKGGDAIAGILFGDVNPSGRLPLTFYSSDDQLRPVDEYDITMGNTYLYFKGTPLYPFGYGLSYTSFSYSQLLLSKATASDNEKIVAQVNVANTGSFDGDEVVQLYVHARQSIVPMPIRQLRAFKRISISKGQAKTIKLEFNTKDFGYWDEKCQAFVVEPGEYDISVGGSSRDLPVAQILNIEKKPERSVGSSQ